MSVTCSRLAFSPGTLVSSINKTDCHDITEILLKVALNTITLMLNSHMNDHNRLILWFFWISNYFQIHKLKKNKTNIVVLFLLHFCIFFWYCWTCFHLDIKQQTTNQSINQSSSKSDMLLPWYSWKTVPLAFNNNRPITHS